MTSDSRTWLITGANRGLGRALVDAVLASGDRVIATVRGAHDLPAHEHLLVERLDVRHRDAARAIVARAERLDVLVNNAGFGLIGAVEEVSEAEAREILDTDLLGALWLTQAAIPGMRTRGSGHIVQISTVGAVGTMPAFGLYNAAKWGLEGFSEALAGEVQDFGIRVTIVEPDGLDTEWATSSMRFSTPLPEYDALRTRLFGTPEVPWPDTGEPAGGTSPTEAAAAILAHVRDADDTRLRLLVGADAAGQVAAALGLRQQDYARDPRYGAA